MSNGTSQERLIVEDREHLHLLGRFFQAMILNFLKNPSKVRIIEKTSLIVTFEPPGHPENGLTISFARGHVSLECGVRPNAEIKIIAEPSVQMMLSHIPAGVSLIPYFKTYEGWYLLSRMKSGELKIMGSLRHPLKLLRLAKIMAPNTN
jgi:hypothetical protein